MIAEEEFVGEFPGEHYTITKSYIETEVDQIRLYHQRYSPKDPKYTLCIIHGFGEHSTRFKSIADFFARNQFEVLMVDLRGFGFSGGARGCAEVRELENDVIHMLKTARSGIPLFLYAHSMGGLVAIKLLMDRPNISVSGCIVTSPLLGLAKSMHFNWIKKMAISYLGEDLSDFIVNSRVNPTALTKKTKYLHTIFDDRMMLPFMSIKMAKYMFEAIDQVMKNCDSFNFPIKIFHGKLDTVTNCEDSRRFIYQKVKPFREYHLFDNGYHELQHDKEKDELLDLALEFLQRIPNPKNFGPMSIHPIKKPVKKGLPYIKIILAIVAVLFMLRRFKMRAVVKN